MCGGNENFSAFCKQNNWVLLEWTGKDLVLKHVHNLFNSRSFLEENQKQICSCQLLHNISLLFYNTLKTMPVEGTQVNKVIRPSSLSICTWICIIKVSQTL